MPPSSDHSSPLWRRARGHQSSSGARRSSYFNARRQTSHNLPQRLHVVIVNSEPLQQLTADVKAMCYTCAQIARFLQTGDARAAHEPQALVLLKFGSSSKVSSDFLVDIEPQFQSARERSRRALASTPCPARGRGRSPRVYRTLAGVAGQRQEDMMCAVAAAAAAFAAGVAPGGTAPSGIAVSIVLPPAAAAAPPAATQRGAAEAHISAI